MKRLLTCPLLLILIIGSPIWGQADTKVLAWRLLQDPNAESGETQPIRALTPIAGLPGAKVEMTLGCHHGDDRDKRTDYTTVDPDSNTITVFITMFGAKIDKVMEDHDTRAVLHIKQRWDQKEELSNVFEYLVRDQELGILGAYTVPPDLYHFQTRFSANLFANAKNEYILGFSAELLDLTLHINRNQPVVSSFVQNCAAPTAKQHRLEKSWAESRAEFLNNKAAADAVEEKNKAAIDAVEEKALKEKNPLLVFMKIPPGSKPTITTKADGSQQMSFLTTTTAYAFQFRLAQSSGRLEANRCGLEKYCAPYTPTKAGDEIHLPSGIHCSIALNSDYGPAVMIDNEPFIAVDCTNVPASKEFGGGYFPLLSFLVRPGSLQ